MRVTEAYTLVTLESTLRLTLLPARKSIVIATTATIVKATTLMSACVKEPHHLPFPAKLPMVHVAIATVVSVVYKKQVEMLIHTS